MSNINHMRETIMKHYREPDFAGKLDSDGFSAYSDRCVDNTTYYIDGTEVINDIKHTSEGCSAFLASTDILAKELIGKTKEEVSNIVESFEAMVNQKEFDASILGDLIVFENIGKQMNRADCALTPIKGIKEWLKK